MHIALAREPGDAAPVPLDLGLVAFSKLAAIARGSEDHHPLVIIAALKAQALRYETALDNLSHGVCFFDNQARVILANRRYAEIYGLRADQVRPGATLRQVAEARLAAGAFPSMSCEEYLEWCDSIGSGDTPRTWTSELTNGRTIQIHHQPMPDGGWVATHEDITDRLHSEEQIRHMAHHDALTDLPNRVLFLDRLAQVAARSHAAGARAAVLYLDLDRFKEINDTLGHGVGDRLLQAAASRIQGFVRSTDILARLGGDEFAVALSDVPNGEAVARTAQQIIEAMAQPFDLDGYEAVCGVSIGIALCGAGGEMKSPERLLRDADMALYRAKGDGRGTYRFFEREMDVKLQARKALELEIRQAIACDELEVYYQPKVDAHGRRVTGVEALVRWRHPTRGIVAPAAFIPLAEETGLILAIGERVLRLACAEAAGWRPLTLAVNLSPLQLRHPGLPELVASILHDTGFEAERLELEITESMLLQDTETVLSTLRTLKLLGIRIAMDDFGTGYSSLNYLRRFPFDRLKIDRSFIQDLSTHANVGAIVKAAIAMGQALGIETTAEGVETCEQANALHQHGCDELQGYLFGRPMPADAFEQFMLVEGAC